MYIIILNYVNYLYVLNKTTFVYLYFFFLQEKDSNKKLDFLISFYVKY